MKKGEIREGIVSEVKFPNKGNVRLLPKEGEENGRDEWATVKNVLPGDVYKRQHFYRIFLICGLVA